MTTLQERIQKRKKLLYKILGKSSKETKEIVWYLVEESIIEEVEFALNETKLEKPDDSEMAWIAKKVHCGEKSPSEVYLDAVSDQQQKIDTYLNK